VTFMEVDILDILTNVLVFIVGFLVKYFNFYWQDMTAPSLALAQNTIRVALTEILKGGKVAVHCHAGYGRTGIVVACLALILEQLSAKDAISLVRKKR
jgi:protein tyrosine phosphatase domain-containing protein 1